MRVFYRPDKLYVALQREFDDLARLTAGNSITATMETIDPPHNHSPYQVTVCFDEKQRRPIVTDYSFSPTVSDRVNITLGVRALGPTKKFGKYALTLGTNGKIIVGEGLLTI